MQWDIAVVGGGNTDYTARGERFPERGGSAPADAFLVAPGGKGVNQAVGAARLGARVALVARVGDDARGREIRDYLVTESVDAGRVILDAECPTGATLIMVDGSGEHQTMGMPGANRRLSVDDVRTAEPLERARVVLLQLEPPQETITDAAQRARAHEATVVLDAGPAQPVADELIRAAAVVRANEQEAEAVTGMPVRDLGSARRAAGQLLARGAGAAVLAVDDQGDLMVWHGGERWLPHFAVRRVDVTGAGDAFVAALAVALSEGRTLAEAGPFASAAAALTTTALGVRDALPRRADVTALMSAQAPAAPSRSTDA
jgi:ribokinase